MLGYKLIGDITVASAQTSVSFTGLNITKDDDYLLVSDLYNPTSATGQYYLYANGDTTATNYYSQFIVAQSSTISADRRNYPYFVPLDSTYRNEGICSIKLTNNGYFTYQSKNVRNYGVSSVYMIDLYGTSTWTTSSLTSLTISGADSAGIGVGSRFRLYKLTTKKVADITIGTATTQIDITGLAIDKSSEYMLVSDIKNTVDTATGAQITINGNNTVTNYYTQILRAVGTLTQGQRVSNPVLLNNYNLSNNISICQIKLTNSGYFTAQSNLMIRLGTDQIEASQHYISSIFTSDIITQISIKSTALTIGVGSKFTLYKLI